jgi:hypothetical protein
VILDSSHDCKQVIYISYIILYYILYIILYYIVLYYIKTYIYIPIPYIFLRWDDDGHSTYDWGKKRCTDTGDLWSSHVSPIFPSYSDGFVGKIWKN